MKLLLRVLTVSVSLLVVAVPVHSQTPTGPEVKQPEILDEACRDFAQTMKLTIDEALEVMRAFDVVDDPRHYLEYEVLPNGDIILRRRPGAPVLPVKKPVKD